MTSGELVIAILTIVCAGGAAFIGAKAAKRSTDVEDKREREKAEQDRLDAFIHMACSTNPVEAYVGLYHLQEAKAEWNENPKQRLFVKRSLEALNAPQIQAYRGGATQVQTTPSNPASAGGGP